MRDIAWSSRASQNNFELWKLLELLKSNPPKRILEIGVDKGYLCATWRQAFPDALVIGIDNNDAALDFKDFKFIHGNSHDPSIRNKLLEDGLVTFDLIFIDGDHSYSGVLTDYELFGPLVSNGGVIAFHDVHNDHIEGIECGRFFNEQRAKHASVDIHNPHNGPGIGVLFF